MAEQKANEGTVEPKGVTEVSLSTLKNENGVDTALIRHCNGLEPVMLTVLPARDIVIDKLNIFTTHGDLIIELLSLETDTEPASGCRYLISSVVMCDASPVIKHIYQEKLKDIGDNAGKADGVYLLTFGDVLTEPDIFRILLSLSHRQGHPAVPPRCQTVNDLDLVWEIAYTAEYFDVPHVLLPFAPLWAADMSDDRPWYTSDYTTQMNRSWLAYDLRHIGTFEKIAQAHALNCHLDLDGQFLSPQGRIIHTMSQSASIHARSTRIHWLAKTMARANTIMRLSVANQTCCPKLRFEAGPYKDDPRREATKTTNCTAVIMGFWIASLEANGVPLTGGGFKAYIGSLAGLHARMRAACDQIKCLRGHDACNPAQELRDALDSCIDLSRNPWCKKTIGPSVITHPQHIELLHRWALQTGLATDDQFCAAPQAPVDRAASDAERRRPLSFW